MNVLCTKQNVTCVNGVNMKKYTHKLAVDVYVMTLGTFYKDEFVTILGFHNGLVRVQIRNLQFFTSSNMLKLNKSV